eukprot:192331-Amphidinium_carterae.1
MGTIPFLTAATRRTSPCELYLVRCVPKDDVHIGASAAKGRDAMERAFHPVREYLAVDVAPAIIVDVGI